MIRPIARYGLLLAIACAIAVATSGPGYRLGWWPLPVAFGILRWATYAAVVAVLAGATAVVLARRAGSRRDFVHALAAIAIGVTAMAGPLTLVWRGKQVPPIHDVSTDTDNPPQFFAVLPLRAGAANPAAYGGPDVAAQQKKAYPHLAPLLLAVPPREAAARARAVAYDMGWTVIAADRDEGRIEATATTPFFGFKDDVVIRVAPAPQGSRVDVRSVSRIGKSDLGTNARRIESFLERLGAGS